MANLRTSIALDRAESDYDILQTFYVDPYTSLHKVVKRNTAYSNLVYLLKKYRFENAKLANKILKEGLVMMTISNPFIMSYEDVYLEFEDSSFYLCVVSDYHAKCLTQVITKDTTEQWTERMDLKDFGNVLLQLVSRFKEANPEAATNPTLLQDIFVLGTKLSDVDASHRPSVDTVLNSLPSDSPPLRETGLQALNPSNGQSTDVTCRQIALNEIEVASQVYLAAFENDARFAFPIPDPEKRAKSLRSTAIDMNMKSHIRAKHARWALFKDDKMIGIAFWGNTDNKNKPPFLEVIKGTVLLLKSVKLMRVKLMLRMLKKLADSFPSSCYMLHEVCIHPEFQGQGHGVTLLEPMIDWSIHAKTSVITFTFCERNLHFFTKLGFEVLSQQSKSTKEGDTLSLWLLERKWEKPRLSKTLPPAYFVNDNNAATADVKKISDIVIQTKIGTGNFGEVYKGVWQGTTLVALKRLRESNLMEEFLAETKILQQLEMPNILRFFGMYTDTEGYNYMVTEYMSRGNLRDFLDTNEKKLTEFELLMICKDAAAGMKFMSSKGFVHRDLAARNLLVREEERRYTVKIADFGLAKLIETNYYAKHGSALPIRWCSPEVLMKQKFSVKSDVWAFGVVVWEIFEFGKVPYFGLSNAEVGGFINSGQRLSKPAKCPEDLYQLIERCWHNEPEFRPNFDEIYEFLAEMTRHAIEISSSSAPVVSVAHEPSRERAPTVHNTNYKPVLSLASFSSLHGASSPENSQQSFPNNENNIQQ